MKLPLLISVPHAGVQVPPEVQGACRLTKEQIIKDGDEGAADIYDLEHEAEAFVTTRIGRAIVDLNRAEDDRRADGVIKTHTCFNEQVYDPFPSEDIVQQLLARYYRPYHERLTEHAQAGGLRLGVDCHTMLAVGPPIGPGPGERRPYVCLSNADGTCPDKWLSALASCFERAFGSNVSINDPFKGGYITRAHAVEMPWVQLELSRETFVENSEKRERVLSALTEWCRG